jgi:hypothetical protein
MFMDPTPMATAVRENNFKNRNVRKDNLLSCNCKKKYWTAPTTEISF